MSMLMFTNLLPILYYYLRPFIKWFLHTFTRLCELQRICYGAKMGASRSKQVEKSLELTRNKALQEIIKELDEQIEHCNDEEFSKIPPRFTAIVMREKGIKLRSHPDFPGLFSQCIAQIWGYKRLMYYVEHIRSQLYDAENLDHETKLLQLWTELMPESQLTDRITKQWQDIGFQGDDPKTDFRGMGLLGLENLLYFAKEYNDAARHVLLHSLHPRYGYTFAIVGINLTSMAYRMLKMGSAKSHFYNIARSAATMSHFHEFYCYLFFEFDRFWMDSEPTNIMDFSIIYNNFEATILTALESDDTVFKTNLVVEDV